MEQDAVFVAASGEIDVFEEEPMVSRVAVPATGAHAREPGAKRARHERSLGDLSAAGPDEGFLAWARDSKLAQEPAPSPDGSASDSQAQAGVQPRPRTPGEAPKTG